MAGRRASWWSRAWTRAIEECVYEQRDLTHGRRIARQGLVGGIRVVPGRAMAAVEDPRGPFAVTIEVPALDAVAQEALVEVLAAQAGRLVALLAGDLPHDLVEAIEEVGVELLPYGGELTASCSCEPWVDPCRHAVAVLTRLGTMLDADPLVLLALRGLRREDLLARVHAAAGPDEPTDAGATLEEVDDVDLAYDAVVRAVRLLHLLEAGERDETDPDLTHLL
ncbi:SWIM zinc finger family protein [Nocardioides acrostichi]|uniref:SWIM zinc finger family protein n=1 Tax=Nocardioides acrostichi TaxID=2784339 RepID=A0A930V4I1_9ACTN|nr:SWIM zinc finger family protein [Nocardioides acrostichi]MBF4163696.1 SWIM zinc finger family protein [Nocardioides acrostichi]